MSPAFPVILMRLLCAGLCCIALSTHANDHVETGVAPDNHNNPTAQVQQTDVASAASQQSAQQPVQQSPAQSATIPGATTPVAINATPIGGGRHLVSVTLALLGIILLIFAISWFVKRFGQGGFAQNQHIKIISTMPLGTRERIVLIDACGQQLLLGITATAINTLHVFSEPVVLPEKEERSSDFSRKLMAILQQKSTGVAGEQNNNNDDSATR